MMHILILRTAMLSLRSLYRSRALPELARLAQIRSPRAASVLAHHARGDLQLRLCRRNWLRVRVPVEYILLRWEHHHLPECVSSIHSPVEFADTPMQCL